jgi:hypothetical protein
MMGGVGVGGRGEKEEGVVVVVVVVCVCGVGTCKVVPLHPTPQPSCPTSRRRAYCSHTHAREHAGEHPQRASRLGQRAAARPSHRAEPRVPSIQSMCETRARNTTRAVRRAKRFEFACRAWWRGGVGGGWLKRASLRHTCYHTTSARPGRRSCAPPVPRSLRSHRTRSIGKYACPWSRWQCAAR